MFLHKVLTNWLDRLDPYEPKSRSNWIFLVFPVSQDFKPKGTRKSRSLGLASVHRRGTNVK